MTTKRTFFLLTTLVTALAFPTFSWADEHEETPLGEQMEIMGDAFKLLRRQAGDAEKGASTLELLGELRAAAVKAAEFKPEYTADQPADEQASFVEHYQQGMQDFIGLVDEAIAAVKAEDFAQAEELVGKMRDAQRSGHKAFRRPKA